MPENSVVKQVALIMTLWEITLRHLLLYSYLLAKNYDLLDR